MKHIRQHLTYANVMATIAVFGVVAGGGAYAASKIGPNDIARNAVHSKHIKRSAVNRSKIDNRAVNSAKLARRAVRASDLGPISVVTKTITIPNNSNGQDAAFCPDGTQRIGGGAASQVFGMPISGSRPDGDTAWGAYARNDTGAPRDLTIYALCLKG